VHRQSTKKGERQQKRRTSDQTQRCDTFEQRLALEDQVPQFVIGQQ